MRGLVHHVDLTVTDAAVSRPLYDLFLGHAGYVVVADKGTCGADWGLGGATYPEYGDGYYAVFFADPDGLKVECVFTPTSG